MYCVRYERFTFVVPLRLLLSTHSLRALRAATKTYNDQLGQSACPQCQPGRYQVCYSSSDLSVLFDLELDFIVAPEQDQTGNTTCIDCAPGKAATIYGALSCTPCVSGTYTLMPGEPSCLPCPGMTSHSHSLRANL